MKYLLFVYGDYTEKDNHVELIAEFLTPNCVNNSIKFQHGPAGAIYHFESKIDPKKLGKFFYVATILMTLARIAAGVHYPSDILAGMIIGIACGWFTFKYITPLLKVFFKSGV